MYRKYFKRVIDFVLSLIAIIVLSPAMVTIAILVRTKIGSPILFHQKRVGKDEKIFTMYKFRSMTNEKNENGELLPDNIRLTRLGRILRSTSLDELPELINILKGDMSIVGPRPLLESYLPYYTEEERLRHSVRGGLTPPEVLYNDFTPTWDKQLEYEVHYAKNVSFLLDLQVVCATIKGVLARNNNDYGSYIREEIWDIREKRKDV
ncbi:sugar transferase [Cohnella faecalis]|uniref:Sugar transferase n=1 Tax=Cohnella faecalis TaxID=2315694 RepID=A0A398CUI0_9BACL|nr:sugar transferase [Cohnella faecalis]RIE04298.1 sugar transferase [Cohnella faecalis]